MLKDLAGKDNLNMTMLALNLSKYINGVAKKHGEVSQQMFPGYRIHAITNGQGRPTRPPRWLLQALGANGATDE